MSRISAGLAILLSLSVLALLAQLGALEWLSLEETAAPGHLTSRRVRIDIGQRALELPCLV